MTRAINNKVKLNSIVSVTDFGAVGNGSDSTVAFSLAAKAALGVNNIPLPEGNINRAPMASVKVPAGTYLLSAEIDTGGKEITWIFDQGTLVNGFGFINGKILRAGQRQNDYHHGTTDYACSYSIRSNTELEAPSEILGISTPTELGVYTDRDSVSLYVDNESPPVLVDISTATYTATSITLGSVPPAASVLRYRVGMIIDTKHATKWSGFITAWNSDGSVITVSSWHLGNGVGTPGTPANGTGAYVNPITKVWAHNANVQLTLAGHATSAAGFELGLINSKGNSSPVFTDLVNRCWGYDSVNLGAFFGQAAYVSRGQWRYGYLAYQQEIGFKYISPPTPGTPFVASDSNASIYWQVNSSGSMEIGSTVASSSVFLDFHSSGNANDYDSRILAVGGGAGAGQGSITISAVTVTSPTILPPSDATQNIGSGSLRWNTLYASTGVINTSDARAKTPVIGLTGNEVNAAKLLGREIGTYKFLSAVATKGEEARCHIGMTVQRVIQILTENQLNPLNYGFICYDEWDASVDQLDNEGNVVVKGVEAGNRYGFRMDELLAFIAAGFEARLSALELT
jgi:hypothetical protein